MPRFDVTIAIDRTTSVQECAKLFEGLNRLARNGTARVRFVASRSGEAYPRVVRLFARDGASERRIAIDLADQSRLFHEPDLIWANCYFKRSFRPSAASALDPPLAAKLQPFGLNNPAIGRATAAKLLTARAKSGRSAGELARDARQLLALPPPQAFESPPEEPAGLSVFFQTRVWPCEDPEVVAINEQRAALVRGLRAHFGRRFRGGIIPDDFAQAHYGDVLTPLPVSMRAYPRVMKRSLVAVYSRGLHDSTAFKMSEYLAASRCILAEPPHGALPEPLEEGTHFLGFDDPDECVARCDRLLSEPSAAAEMRRHNWRYYRASVEPAAHLLKTLERAFALPAA